jgi:hypothetical protein
MSTDGQCGTGLAGMITAGQAGDDGRAAKQSQELEHVPKTRRPKRQREVQEECMYFLTTRSAQYELYVECFSPPFPLLSPALYYSTT